MDDEAEAVTLRTGERTTIRLPGLGTVGYQWTHRVEGDADAVAVSLSTVPRGDVDGPPGVSVDEQAVIEARHPGRATVILEQRRSWETKPTAQDRRVVTVTVT